MDTVALWKSRNDLLLNSKDWYPQITHSRTEEDIADWLTFNQVVQTTTHSTGASSFSLRMKNWQPSLVGWVKCNYDVSHHRGSQPSGMGWIIRNHLGNIQECGMGKFEGRRRKKENQRHWFGLCKLHFPWVTRKLFLKEIISMWINASRVKLST